MEVWKYGSMVRERYRMVSECCNIDLLIKYECLGSGIDMKEIWVGVGVYVYVCVE